MSDDLLFIPLRKLGRSSLNVRKTGADSIEDLAASILAHGLIQNLTVAKRPTPTKGSARTKDAGDTYEVSSWQMCHPRSSNFIAMQAFAWSNWRPLRSLTITMPREGCGTLRTSGKEPRLLYAAHSRSQPLTPLTPACSLSVSKPICKGVGESPAISSTPNTKAFLPIQTSSRLS